MDSKRQLMIFLLCLSVLNSPNSIIDGSGFVESASSELLPLYHLALWNDTRFYEQAWGGFNDIVLVDSYVIIATNSLGLLILDVSNPIKPALIQEIHSNITFTDLALTNDLLYASAKDEGLFIFDISNPLNFILENKFLPSSRSFSHFYFQDDLGFAAWDQDGFTLLNLSSPTEPAILSEYNSTLGSVYDIISIQKCVYIAYGSNGFESVNVSDSLNPTQINYYNQTAPFWDDEKSWRNQVFSFFTHENSLFLGKKGEFDILDISNPLSIELLGSTRFSKLTYGYDEFTKMQVVGNYLYSSRSGDGLTVYDISNYSSIFYTSSLYFQYPYSDGDYSSFRPFQKSFVLTDYLFLVDSIGMMNIIDPGFDTDSDGMTDGWERIYGLDPFTIDGNMDLDADGLTNYWEFQNHTYPNRWDSDRDGMADGWEVFYDLNPLLDDGSLDFDNDTLLNRWEYGNGTNPLDADTDGDWIPDQWDADPLSAWYPWGFGLPVIAILALFVLLRMNQVLIEDLQIQWHLLRHKNTALTKIQNFTLRMGRYIFSRQ
ncbi:LVIVD repeat-containing protein [Candidatus Lokiarchaeum ossiferum]|uniref:LVIVD repeat-containing protein n=1 Tax=Candidatus Lokiarchaeum ossiferum TaxID=2951803 RepID=UPI00352EDD4D